MASLPLTTSHNMATHNGLTRSQPQKQQQQTKSNTSDNNNQIGHVPYDLFVKSGYNEFEFWLHFCKPTQLTYSVETFVEMRIPQQANVLFGQNFHSLSTAIQFIHDCIKKEMIWQPHCPAFESNGSFSQQFIIYCTNWMIIMYQILWYIRKLQLTPAFVKSLEKAFLSKLNELHTGVPSHYTIHNLKWNNASLLPSPFPKAPKGYDPDITIRSYNKHKKKTITESKVNEWMEDNDEQTQKQQKQEKLQYLKLIKMDIENIHQGYVDLENDIKEIKDQSKLKNVIKDVKSEKQKLSNYWNQMKKYEKQLPNLTNIIQMLLEIRNLAHVQQKVTNVAMRIHYKQTQEEIKKYKHELHQQQNGQGASITHATLSTNINQQQMHATQNIQHQQQLLNHNEILIKQQQQLQQQQQQWIKQKQENNQFNYIKPETYTQYSRDLKANKSKQVTEKDDLKEEKDANKRLNVKFSGEESNVSRAAIEFMYAIQKEAESLIELNVFNEPLFVDHVIYKCLTEKALKAFHTTRASDIMPLTPQRVSEVTKWIIEHWDLSEYIEAIKQEFEQFNANKYSWLQIVPEFRQALKIYQMTATACGIQGQYQIEFSEQYLVTMLKNKLPNQLINAINDIRYESAQQNQTNNVLQEQQLQLPEPKTLTQLQNLIKNTKRKVDFKRNGKVEPQIQHGFSSMNAQQKRDRSQYPKQQYPRPGKPTFNPRTSTQPYGTTRRDSKNQGNKYGKQLTFKEFRTPYIVPPTTTPQNRDVGFKDRPKYWHGLCTKCNIHGHHPKSCDAMHTFWNTLEHYCKLYFWKEYNKNNGKGRGRRMNQMKNQTETVKEETKENSKDTTATNNGAKEFFTAQ